MPATHRLLFGINHKPTEDKIAEQIKDSYLSVGAITYREGIVPALLEYKADTVLLRDTLGGSVKIDDLIQQIRLECPLVRIIFICSQRPKTDPLISTLISYGIYDLIISDSVPVQTIISYILHPRNFRDVAAYFKPINFEDPAEEPTTAPRKEGLLSGLFQKRGDGTKSEAKASVIQPEPSPTAHNIDAMRKAIQEEADRKAQANIDKIIKAEVAKQTRTMDAKLKEAEAALAAANASLREKLAAEISSSRDVEQLHLEVDRLRTQLQHERDEAEKIKTTYEEQLLATQSTSNPEWFAKKSQEWEQEKADLQAELAKRQVSLEELLFKLDQTNKELAERKALGSGGDISVDYSFEDGSIILPDNTEYAPVQTGGNHVFLFMGARHGIGTTTMALNTATLLAAKGQKTILLELNDRFPMVNSYFEFTNLTAGIDTACTGLANGNHRAVEAAIIKPHGLTPAKKALGKVYKKLPGPLHFMLFSNVYLLNEKAGKNKPLETAVLKDLIYTLLIQLKYANVVIDIQTDDRELMDICLGGNLMADKLVLTLNQDPQTLAAAGHIITDLARSSVGSLLKGAVYSIGGYIHQLDPNVSKIAKYLNVNAKQCLPITFDKQGYVEAAMRGLPYVSDGGKHGSEYAGLTNLIL